MRMFNLYHAGEFGTEVVMWKDKSVTTRTVTGQEQHYRSLATLLVAEVRLKTDYLVEVDSEGQEGQRWEGQQEK